MVADEVAFAPGDVLAEQGRSPAWFFLIRSGTAQLERDGAPLGVVREGETYGEVPLLGRGMHPVTLRAMTPVSAWVIGCQRFSPLVDDVRSIRVTLEASVQRQPALLAIARAERAKRIRPMRCPPPTQRRSSRPRRGTAWSTVAGVAVAALVAFAAVYHPPLAVIRPGPVVDVAQDIEVSGATVHPVHGRYLLLTVRSARPTLLGVVAVALRGGQDIEHVEDLAPDAHAEVQGHLRREFLQSQRDATLAAAGALGIHGQPPFTVRFRDHDVVGPSAGLIYALAIDDLLSGADSARGRVIAATGEIAPSGEVRPVSYVREKAVGARRAGAQVLLTPTQEAYQAGADMPVVGVSSLQDALAQLSGS